MEKDDRSVIQRLDDIENKILTQTAEAPISISEVIGRPFSQYLEEAKLYGFEPDERKLERTLLRKKRTNIIWLPILFLVLIFEFISLIVNKSIEWVLIMFTFSTILCHILFIIVLFRCKNKQPLYSFWNIKNRELYLVPENDHKRIAQEETNGIIFYILMVLKIISTIVGIVGTLFYLIISARTNGILFFLMCVFWLRYYFLQCSYD